ncbi:hypothetical protein A2332_01135 [Candidatus Uhrbacteria bacterium RIFOXYB2_FULL_41_18]|nr:MAG: hypothetical protein A2332_01135 [Candidatus Uhrbacteria bacterium RIFOXYB2_FULL_41_18]
MFEAQRDDRIFQDQNNDSGKIRFCQSFEWSFFSLFGILILSMSHNPMGKSQTVNVSTMTFVKVVLIILAIWFLWFIRDIVAIFLVALLLAGLIDPFADWFAKKRIPRGLAVLIVYVVLGALVIAITILLVPVVIEQSIQLLSNFSSTFGGVTQFFGEGFVWGSQQTNIESLLPTLQSFHQSLSGSVSSLFSTLKGFVGGLVALFIVLVLAFYMVVEEENARKYFRNLAPLEYQPYIGQLLQKIQTKIGSWLRGQIILGLIVGLAVFVGLSLLGVEYALLLAIIAGLLEVIPYVGPIISLIPAVIIGFAHSPIQGILVLALYLFIQQLENNILVPKIMQKVTGLNPIISIAALLIGVKLGGLVGAVLSIPVATLLVVILEDLFKDMK